MSPTTLLRRLAAVLVTTLAVSTLTSVAPAQARIGEDNVSYQPQVSCDPVAKVGVLASRKYLQAHFGGGDLGIVRACNVGGLSEHKEGRAWDWAFNAKNTQQKAKATKALKWLTATDTHGVQGANARSLGAQYLIWNRRMWSAYRSDAGWRPYTGTNPHTDHIHISFTWNGATKATTRWNKGVVQPLDFGPCQVWVNELAPRWKKANLNPCAAPIKRPVASANGIYIAQTGETVTRVARFFKHTNATIRLWNGYPTVGPVVLSPGMRIQVTKPAVIPPIP